MSKLTLIVLLSSLSLCYGYKLLLVFPFPSLSNSILGQGFVRNLLKAGHEVTYITPYPIKNATKALRQIEVTNNTNIWTVAEHAEGSSHYIRFDKPQILAKEPKFLPRMFREAIEIKKHPNFNREDGWKISPTWDPIIHKLKAKPKSSAARHQDTVSSYCVGKEMDLEDVSSFMDTMLKIANATLNHKNVQKLLNEPKEQFDAVILEWMYSEVYAGFSSVFNCPLIWSSPLMPNSFVLSLINEDSSAYSSGPITSTSPWPKIVEQYRFLRMKFYRWLLSDKEKSLFNRAFGPAAAKRGAILPPFEVIKYNGSLVLGNSHYSIGQKIRSPLNYIEIAGYHVDDKREILPKNLQKIMDGSKKGVVYISFGSMFRESLASNIETAILNVSKKINRTVIWKYDKALKTPNNVHVFKHVEQQSILAHKNCALFITNGDLLSVIEAIHFGIPLIGIPINEDRITNMKNAEDKGFARIVDFQNIMSLKTVIEDILQNPKYREAARSISSIYHDRPITPGKELVFWIEHVVRKGALHLRSTVTSHSMVNIDVAIIVVVLVTCFIVLFACIYILFRRRAENEVDYKKFI